MLNENELIEIVSYLAKDPRNEYYTRNAIEAVLSLTQYLQVIAALILLKADCSKNIDFVNDVIAKWKEIAEKDA